MLFLVLLPLAYGALLSEHDFSICKSSATYTEHLFRQWMDEYNMEFSDTKEYAYRHGVFLDNLKRIAEHNADPTQTFKMAMNQFGHLKSDEWKTSLCHSHKGRKLRSYISDANIIRIEKMPESVDWVAKNAVTEVKNQGTCGSCWTFSAVGAIGGASAIHGGPLQTLSMQQIVDCDPGGNGCDGGLMDQAFIWESANDGLCSLKDYPYTSGKTGATGKSCLSSSCQVVPGSRVESHTDVLSTDHALMAAIVQQPVSVAIEADQSTFQFYSSGVMTQPCGTNLDHGVLAVGYGTSEDGIDYYKIKNSWGSTWGEEGYIRLERGGSQEKGQCGILSTPSYPNMV